MNDLTRERSRAALLIAVALLGATLIGVAPVRAQEPAASEAVAGDGSVQLADGRTLPPLPPEMAQPSVHAEMLAEHPAESYVFAQGDVPSVPRADPAASSPYRELGFGGEQGGVQALAATGLPNGLAKEVLGFLPHWLLGEVDSLKYDTLSTIAYFGVQANADGNLDPYGGWASPQMTQVTNLAHARGVRVVLTVTMMAWDSAGTQAQVALLTSAANRTRLVSQIVTAVGSRNADGVNLDFEPLPTSLRSQYVAFVRELKAALLNAGVGSYVTVSVMAGAATWATGYDVVGLTQPGAADHLFVMSYDYHYAGSSRAGAVAPMESPWVFDVTDSMADFRRLVPGPKLIYGVPYYGRTWTTASADLNALTCTSSTCPGVVRSSSAYYYTGHLAQAVQYGRRWDPVGATPWYVYWDSARGSYVQGYYDDPTSLAIKYDYFIANDVAGTGIWALLYDQGTNDLSNVLTDKFVRQSMRLFGSDRFETAAAASRWFYAPGVPVAYVATGLNFPDALAGGPAAVYRGGPLLLVGDTYVPAATQAELARLRPGRIFVLGGPGVVSGPVADYLAQYTTGGVERIFGADRYATAAAVSATTFPRGTTLAFVATGADFPDALAAGAAAGHRSAPVLLVERDAIPAATSIELARLAPQRIYVVGGPGVVSDAVLSSLDAIAPDGAVRLAGADRYETAARVSWWFNVADGPDIAYVATGLNFPDALSTVPLAAGSGSPLMLVPPTTVPSVVGEELKRVNPRLVVVTGGPSVVSDGVLRDVRSLYP